MAKYVSGIQLNTLQACRRQLELSLEEVQRHVPKIAEVEAGNWRLTFSQLETLSELYRVPRWVFLLEEIPQEYLFQQTIPDFRKLKNMLTSEPKSRSKIVALMARLDQFRSTLLEMREDLGQDIAPFSPPEFTTDIREMAQRIRQWLGIPQEEYPSFVLWRQALEEQGVLVFLTSKYPGWSHIDRELFRGLALSYDVLPIIVINDSDAKKAQVFTLFHELGHLLQQTSHTGVWEQRASEEVWCDRFAGEVLMPSSAHFSAVATLKELRRAADQFNVSAYAYLVRLRQLRHIDERNYLLLEDALTEAWEQSQRRFRESTGGPPRIRAKEILNQYGSAAYTVLQAYSENELNIVQALRVLDVTKARYITEMMEL